MSLAPHAAYLRDGVKMGDLAFVDTMIKDGLWDAFNGYHMGITAENIAPSSRSPATSRTRSHWRSQQKASAAQKAGRFKDEIVAGHDEGPQGRRRRRRRRVHPPRRHAEGMAKLRPAFSKEGTVTAGNASGINDGAAALVVMSAAEAAKRGLKPLARIAAFATAGVDPAVMGTGPIPATRKALDARRLEGRRPRPDRGQRGVRRPGLRGQQGTRLGHRRRST